MRKNIKKIAAMTMAAAMISAITIPQVFGYGETSQSSTLITDTQGTSSYQTWKTNTWKTEKNNSGKILLIPGATENDLNFAWYSESSTTAVVKLSNNEQMTSENTYDGTSITIDKTNVAGTNYTSSNKVSIVGDIQPNTTYYYQYSSDNGTTWSDVYTYKSKSSDSYDVILVGDPQIGASGSTGQGTDDDTNIAVDTYNWNKTLTKAIETAPNAAFILSAGDQIDYSTPDGNGSSIRESEYAGYLYPVALRSVPVATTIGNHESKGDDYSLHYNNPNSDDDLGSTTSGGDYYFSYGDTLVISLNSNNRNVEEHRELMEKAVASQYYIAERSNIQVPAFSVISISEGALKIKTYDYNGSKYADDFTIAKTTNEVDAYALLEKVQDIDTSKHTNDSVSALNLSVQKLVELMNGTASDEGAKELSASYDKSIITNNANDPVDYYGYAQSEYKNESSKALKEGFSALLDKTLYNNSDERNIITGTEFENAYYAVNSAIEKLVLVESQTGSNNNAGNEKAANNDNTAPQTGDYTSVGIFVVLRIMSAIGLVALLYGKKKEEK